MAKTRFISECQFIAKNGMYLGPAELFLITRGYVIKTLTESGGTHSVVIRKRRGNTYQTEESTHFVLFYMLGPREC